MTENELIREHGEHVRAFAHSLGYFLAGGDRDDLEQEALLGLLRAWRSYKPERGPFWPRFALYCVRRHLIDAIKTANRGQTRPLTRSLRTGFDENNDEVAVVELLEDACGDPLRRVVAREELRRVVSIAKTMTPLEQRATFGIAAGYSYEELGPSKTIDNASQRGLVKLRRGA